MKTKRIICLLLAFCLAAVLLTAAAWAADPAGKAIRLDAAGIAGAQQSNVYFGNYVQSGSEKEPIRWRVLENAGGQLFLLSDQNLDVYWYHQAGGNITWAESGIRAWLNNTSTGFAGDAFSAVELTAIPQTDVVNDDNPEYGTEGGENTKDQVFLLSIAEATNTTYGFTNNYNSTDTRKATNTAYVASGGKTGGYMYDAGDTDLWWLRSPVQLSVSCHYRHVLRLSGLRWDRCGRQRGSRSPRF